MPTHFKNGPALGAQGALSANNWDKTCTIEVLEILKRVIETFNLYIRQYHRIRSKPWAATVRGQRGHGPPLLLVPIIFWQNSTPFFGIFNFCSSNNDEVREILQPVRVKLKDLQKKLIQAHWGLVHINRKQD